MGTAFGLIEGLESRRLLSTTTLVDFGDAAGNNVYGTPWTTPIYGLYTGYSADGPDGVIGGWTGAYFAAGVSGAAQSFAVGDQIKVTWYNRGATAITGFTPRISFDDPDQSNNGGTGTWLNMDTISIPAGQSATSTYTIDATWAGNRSLVNVHRNVNGTELLLDKIERVTSVTNALTVANGTGDGAYGPGATADIAADPAPQGYQFDRWTGDTAGLASITSASTTYTMPGVAASLAATYVPVSGVVVSTVSGTVTSGSTLNITGLRFGTKAQAAPVKYDNFESGTAGNDLSGWSLIQSGGGNPKYSSTRSFGGSKAGYSNLRTQYTSAAYAANINLTSVYVSYWVYWERISGAVTRNMKLGRISSGSPGDPIHGDPQIGYTMLNGSQSQWYTTADSSTSEIFWGNDVAANGWHRVEMYGKISTINQADGARGIWLDGKPVIPFDNAYMSYTSSSNASSYSHFVLPNYVAHDPGGAHDIYYDDVYIDTTRARVEIGNAPTWEACTQRSIQTPTAWSADSISVTFNPGAFTSGTVYLYVVDENGNANAQGYALTIGQTAVANRPPAVDAGENQRAQTGTAATLDGSVADDGLPGGLSYTWSKSKGPGTIIFGNASDLDTTATFSTPGEYVLQLTATDGNQPRSDWLTILVTDVNNRVPIVNLGSSALNNTFGYVDWNQVTLGTYVGYSANGPAGTKGGSTGAFNTVVVKGANHTYEEGEKVVATWYNDSASSITITPKVSFTDPDGYNINVAGTWYNMSTVTIPAYGTATTSYTIDSGSSGTYSLINVCRFSSSVAALLDKVELEYPAMLLRSAAVAGRHVFYNQSSFGDAIATDKQALLPGRTASFANYTSYNRGINGLFIDIADLPAAAVLTASDFVFRAGKDDSVDTWAAAPAPTSITVRRGAGVNGTDRVVLIWADNAIRNQWLEVSVKATPATGLAAADVFYFGNAVGETGNGSDLVVNATDTSLVVNRYSGRSAVGITNPYDINRDGVVNSTDTSVIVNSYSGRFPVATLSAGPAAASLFSQSSISGDSSWGRLSVEETNAVLT